MLFFPEDVCFWRDYICQEAWGKDYVYLTVVALGSLHRAALMLSRPDELDQSRGLDIKITAVQKYTQALQELSNQFEEAKKTPRLLVAVLCLMAYFEVRKLFSCCSQDETDR